MLSDREVIARAETDLGFRHFLGQPLRAGFPIPVRCISSADVWERMASGRFLIK